MKILLTTLHAKYSHSSLALPCLAAACRDIAGAEIVIREWTVNEPREQLLRLIMAEGADLIAFSCYIWNIEQTLRIVSDIKKIAPRTLIALGGPEASFGVFELMHANPAVDFVVKGEGELVFRQLLETLVDSNHTQPEQNLAEVRNLFFRDGDDIVSGPPGRNQIDLDTLTSPFEAGLVDLEKPLVYYETSRGCPFSCAFCLSSVEGSVRSFGISRIKSDLLLLMHQNVSQIKLVDRTFNYDAGRAGQLWEFILEHNRGSHFHFEIAADLLTDDNLRILAQVSENTFRFEIGIQSASENTLAQVGRKADLARIYSNVRRLKTETKIELHLDLVAGLPDEDYDGFLRSLQAVADLEPHEIQIEPLKVLKGSPMREIAGREEYAFSSHPPYTILRNRWLSYDDICRIETIGRLLDLFQKHGSFATALRYLKRGKSLAAILDGMARRAGTENLSSFSRRRVYELFADLADDLAGDDGREELHDALFFDYCHSEMPLMGKLPSFAAARQKQCSWPGLRDLPEGLDLPMDCRIKAFRHEFINDYRSAEWKKNPAACTFIYVSGAGQGLRVLMV